MSYIKKYLKRAKTAGKLLRFVPFLKMAALNGSIVRGEQTRKSDIDFLIIARAGRLYTARFFATVLIHLTGYRRHGKKIAGRICLNCYLNDKNPDITPKDKESLLKVARAYKHLILLIDNGVSRKFFKVNKWFYKFTVAGEKYSRDLQQNYFKKFPRKPKRCFEKLLAGRFGDWVEKKLMKYQVKKILAGKSPQDEIVATVGEIRLHPRK
ncbi:MAG: nucleotidyltransferase domain-containing protein [Candidatus Berkelbacteria bacterium]|nr:nucleotidyltransferase domain-containing protein [Candidatus Berkelbacteria bacterium]